MFFLTPSDTNKSQSVPLLPEFYSVEFPLGVIQPVYQFKLWRSERNTFFLLAKETSDLVSQLKVGHVVPMKYYSEDAMHATEVHHTQIMEIVKETGGRFCGHYRIELSLIVNGQGILPYPNSNDT
jgi:hypothetical protein